MRLPCRRYCTAGKCQASATEILSFSDEIRKIDTPGSFCIPYSSFWRQVALTLFITWRITEAGGNSHSALSAYVAMSGGNSLESSSDQLKFLSRSLSEFASAFFTVYSLCMRHQMIVSASCSPSVLLHGPVRLFTVR